MTVEVQRQPGHHPEPDFRTAPDFKVLFESIPGLFLVLTPDLRIVAVSDAYTRATMTRREEILGKALFEIFPDNPNDPFADGVRNLEASLKRVLDHRTGDAMAVQKYDIRKPDEEGGGFEERYWSPFNSPVLAPDGSVAYIIHRAEDVTEFVRIKQQGVEQGELNESLRERAMQMEAEIYNRAREVADINTRLKQANDEITRLYQKTQELERERTAELAALLDAVPMPVFIAQDPTCQHIAGNRAADELLRNSPGAESSFSARDETRPRHFKAVKDGRELNSDELPAQRAARGFSVQNFEFSLAFDDGTTREMLAHARPLLNSEGRPRGAINVLVDVTELKQTDAALREQKTYLRAILDSADDAIVTIDQWGIIQSVNPATVRFFGYTPDEMVGQNVKILMPSPYWEEHDQYLQNYRTTGIKKIIGIGREVIAKRKDGSTFPVDLAVSEAKQLKLFTGIIRDISHRKKLEQEVAKAAQAANRSQRLESIGTLAGGIAHDLNNVLTPILMGTRLLTSGRASANQKGLLETMAASAQRGADLIKQLLAFAGGIRGERRPVHIDQLVAETRSLLEHTLPKSIWLETDVATGLPPVLGDATELSQILMNLAVNARDAMPDGGTLSIQAAGSLLNENASQLHPGAHPGRYVVLKVSDTGSGMSPEVLDRIFDPFYTTKEIGKGTGLGLATVQGIVKSYEGFIIVYSEPGRGSKFSIYLPTVATSERAPDLSSQGPVESGDGRTILLVDDETFILQMTTTALEGAGYKVLTAPDGSTAVALFSQRRNDISAVLLDMMMPGLDGLQVLDQLRRIDPEVIVIACSGLRTSQRESEVLERGAKAFLPKPYSEVELLHTLSQVLVH